MEESGVQSLQCLLKEGVGGGHSRPSRSRSSGVKELSNEVSVTETRVELETQKNKEGRDGKVWRSAEGGTSSRYHNTKVDKFIKQELRVTRPGCIV